MADSAVWRPPRACDDYWSEWKHCKSLRNRFHHYYVYGDAPSCQQWKTDYSNCREWESRTNPEAKEALRESEKQKVVGQKKYSPIWKLRKSPPAEWYLPLQEGNPKE
ncbi:synaptic plasticity regulator PANTS isoform X2 [Latimeria chalumnae]|uniref:Synaptic plasticity regulator PANTS n=1 Tax=Latimeria chalumnae TaxID=7897 RepID=H3B5F9_LATCH|nr:PREDICTED: UPF0545 protein C22orf39 homolog [Latimeria chalumnae]|eukprot:XP_005990249.1 PREDICTED: UPF0545 protein C22orf39 homolog [Latimeria chalumnae]